MKDGVASKGALDHGLEDSKKWLHDQNYNEVVSKSGKVQYVALLSPEHEKVSFKSNCSNLRGPFGDTWGYLVPGLVPASVSGLDFGLDSPTGENPKKKRGRPPKTKLKCRIPVPGDPDLDGGGAGLVWVAKTGESLTSAWRRVQTVRRLLNSYDQDKKIGNFRQYVAHGSRSPSHQTLLERKTVDLIPGFSRAIQRMIEDGKTEEARSIIEQATPKILSKFEALYPGAKCSGLGWHVRSGQLHTDLYGHSTRLELVEDGVKKKKRLVRLWDTFGLSHYGPGPGICAWDRHLRALGNDAATVAPGLRLVVDQALARQEKDYGSAANRDVLLHRAVDEIFEGLLPASYREQGMDEYKTWLVEEYSEGAIGPKLNTASKRKAAMEEVQSVAAESKKVIEQKELELSTQAIALAAKAIEIERRELAVAEMEAEIKEQAEKTRSAAEVRGLDAAFEAVFPNEKPADRTAEGILVQIQTGIQSFQTAALANAQAAENSAKNILARVEIREKELTVKEEKFAGRESKLETAEKDVAKREARLAVWAKSWKARLRQLHAKRYSDSIVLILGKKLTTKLFEAGQNPRQMVRNEVARLRRSERVLGELLKLPANAAPDSPAGKLLSRAKSILSIHQIARVPKSIQENSKDTP